MMQHLAGIKPLDFIDQHGLAAFYGLQEPHRGLSDYCFTRVLHIRP